ncbi:hypothetical protein LTS18_013971, partial [Coniosporium uncinatum]
IPEQFRYEAADCRIFYTAAMTLDATAIWSAVANSAWNTLSGKSKCVWGGFAEGVSGMMANGNGGAGGLVKGGATLEVGSIPRVSEETVQEILVTQSLRTRPRRGVGSHGYMMP